ncbi:MAG: prolyl oligopeptidase family serine peptidase [Planctomycetia bacterium]|nr:prolyl oligopeptidase family serine peptidase [Planctomycetia bacterium]
MADSPPVAPVKPVVDDYFGTKITDPYRYLEAFTDPEVQAWVKGQADFAAHTLGAIPGRTALLKRIDELDAGAPYSIYGIARRPNGDLFYFKQLASENVAKVYVRDGASNVERLLVDPETFPKAEPSDHFTLSFYRVSPDGAYLLYGFAASGSEQTSLKVLDLKTGKALPDTIDRLEAEYALPSWLPDGRSFYYSRRRKLGPADPVTEGYKFTQAFRHTLGTDVEKDSLVFGRGAAGSPEMGEMDFPAVLIPTGSTFAIGQVKHGDETDITLYAAPQSALGTADVKWTKVCDRADLVTEFAVRGDDIYLLTALNAPRFQVLRTSLAKPDIASAAVVVPADEYVVDSIAVAQDALYVGILSGVPNKILRVPYEAGAKAEPIALPTDEPSGNVETARPDMPGALVRTRSWIREGRLYRYDPDTKSLVDTKLSPEGKYDRPAGLAATEVLVASHDGVRVPLSIIHRADIKLDGSNPTNLSGYGAYGHTASMGYDPTNLAWLERGGVIAVAHVRGGGAFGKTWHHAGRKSTKPNTWRDFIACAEYLVKQGYTSPAKLAGRGGSAGGILIGRSITERPELFAAANIAVGCTDMLRFETTMNGPPNVPEFGTVTKEEEFRGLLAMSTYQHIRDGVKYPAVILTHGINDPRVEPWQSAKTTARLQASEANVSDARPVLYRVDYHAGHGIGSTRSQRHEERADIWSFFLWQFGAEGFQPKR